MPDWKKLIVGDAFEPSTKDPNYYRDLALLWPLLAFSIATAAALTDDSLSRSYLYKSLAGLIVCLLLAKEKAFLIGVAGAFVAVRALIALFFFWGKPEFSQTLLWVLGPGLVFAAALYYQARFQKGRLSYRWPQKFFMADLLVGMTSLAITLALFVFWVRQ